MCVFKIVSAINRSVCSISISELENYLSPTTDPLLYLFLFYSNNNNNNHLDCLEDIITRIERIRQCVHYLRTYEGEPNVERYSDLIMIPNECSFSHPKFLLGSSVLSVYSIPLDCEL